MADAPPPEPFGFLDAHVVRTRRLTPSMLRVTLGGEELARLRSAGRDQSFSLFLPRAGQQVPDVPRGEDWFPRWRAMDPDVRAVMRSYTVRAQRPELREMDVDFVLHEPAGPASAWALTAVPGDRVTLMAPLCEDNLSVTYLPPADSAGVVLCADDTALPAAAAILQTLPAGLPARVYLEVGTAEDVQEPAACGPDVTVRWLPRADTAPGTPRHEAFLAAVRADGPPPAPGFAWIAGEAATVRTLRRHFVRDLGWDKKRVAFTGYWRLGASEEQLRAEALAKYEAELAAASPARRA